MSKEMNKLMLIVTKYDIFSGLFMSLIIGLVFNHEIALAFLLGMCISVANYITSVLVTTKWLEKKSFRVLIIRIIRIFFVSICVFPFIHNFELILSYLAGFTTHFIVFSYCMISRKGE